MSSLPITLYLLGAISGFLFVITILWWGISRVSTARAEASLAKESEIHLETTPQPEEVDPFKRLGEIGQETVSPTQSAQVSQPPPPPPVKEQSKEESSSFDDPWKSLIRNSVEEAPKKREISIDLNPSKNSENKEPS